MLLYRMLFFIGFCLFGLSPNAAASSSSLAAPLKKTLTHTSTPRLSPAPLPFKIAAVCFAGSSCGNSDAGFGSIGGEDFLLDDATKCQNEGYGVTKCPDGFIFGSPCPYSPSFFDACLSKQKLCEDNGFFQACGDGKVSVAASVCPFDNSYHLCACAPCDGYNYTLSQAQSPGYEPDGSCNSCGELKYRRRNKDCSGFMPCSDCGGAAGAETCQSGGQTYYASCKVCQCPDGTTDLNAYWCGGDLKCFFGGR